jgi:hypothetical protein
MGTSETTGHTTFSITTRSLTLAGIKLSQETNHHSTYLGKPGKPETTSVIDNVSKETKHTPLPCFFLLVFFFFRGKSGGGKGEYRSSPGLLICRQPISMMTDKAGSNPDRVFASLKNRKRTNQGYPTGIFDHLCNTGSVP